LSAFLVEVTFRDEAKLPECAKEEDAVVGGSQLGHQPVEGFEFFLAKSPAIRSRRA
jgi:hypothetical protein